MTCNIIPQFAELGAQFAQHYYRVFDECREHVLPLYHEQAMLTFEDHQAHGHPGIAVVLKEKINFQKIQHQITKIDSQPTMDSGIITLVTGRLKTDDDPPHGFSQTFMLKVLVQPGGGVDVKILHDVFRLSLHNTN